MSNLLKALKRAEQDREAAKQARAQANPGANSLNPMPPEPLAEPTDETGIARPAVTRSQRDAVRPSERIAPPAALPRAANKPYRSVGIGLILATLFAAGVGLTLRNRDTDKPPIPLAIATEVAKATEAAAPLPAAVPAALPASDASPLQLRLDRSVDAIGEMAHQRSNLQ